MIKKPLAVLAVILLLAVSFHVLLREGLFSKPLTQWVASRIESVTGTPVRVERVTLSLVPTYVVLEGVAVSSTEPDRPPISADRIWVSVSPWSLLTEVLFVKKIVLEGLRADFRMGEGLPVPLRMGLGDKSTVPPNTPPRLALVIREITFARARISLSQPDGQALASVEELEGWVLPDLRMKRFDLDWSARKTSLDLKGVHKEFRKLSGKVSILSDSLEIRKFQATGSDTRFTLSGTVAQFSKPELNLSVEAALPLGDLSNLLPPEYPMSGFARISGEVTGSWPEPVVRGNLEVKDWAVASRSAGDFKAAFSYRNRSVSFQDLSAKVFQGGITGDLRFTLPARLKGGGEIPFKYSLTLADLDLSSMLAAAGWAGYPARQRLEGGMEAEGRLILEGAKEANLKLDLPGLSSKGRIRLSGPPASEAGVLPTDSPLPPGLQTLAWLEEIAAHFRLENGLFEADQSWVRSPRSEVRIQGSLRLASDKASGRAWKGLLPPDVWTGPLSARIQMKTSELAELAERFRPFPAGGAVEMNGTISGNLNDPVFTGRARGQALWVHGESFDSAEADINYHGGRIRFENASAQSQGAQYEFRGDLSFRADHPEDPLPAFHIQATIRNGSPRRVVGLFWHELPLDIPVSGQLTAAGNPQAFELRARLSLGEGAIYGQALDEGSVNMVLTRHDIVFEEASARRGETTAAGKGTIRFNGEFEFSVRTDFLRPEDFKPLAAKIPGLTGKGSGSLKGEGSFQEPRFEADLEWADLAVGERPIGPGAASARFRDRLINVDFRLKEQIRGRGELEWVPGFPFRAEFTLAEADLKPWIGKALTGPANVERMAATGTARVEGRLEPPGPGRDGIRGELNLESFGIDFPGYRVANDGPMQVAFLEDTLTFQSVRLRGPGTVLTLSGSLRPLAEFNLFVSGEADLDLIRSFTKEFTYGKGLAYLALQVTDRWADPKIRGGLTIHNATLKSGSLGQAITVTAVGLSFNERQVFLETLEAEFGGGKVQAAGRIDLEGIVPARFGLNLEMNGARIQPIQGLTVQFDASLIFQGDAGGQTLTGEVLLRRASYERRLDWQTWVLEVLTEERTEYRPPEVFKSVAVNIRVEGKNNLWINNNLAKLPLELDLLLKGTLARPVILGRVEARGGTIAFRQNDFRVTSGTVDFIHPDRIRPVIDLQANTQVKNYAIDLSLVGPMDHFDLTLSSNPALKDQNEILCLLTFRSPCREVAEASKEIGAAEATAMISEGIQNILTDKVEDLTGIDRIHVDPYFSSTKAGSGPMITVSKRLLDDRLYVTYATTLDPSQEELIQVEYEITDNISLIGNRNEVGRAGADLKFHFEFR